MKSLLKTSAVTIAAASLFAAGTAFAERPALIYHGNVVMRRISIF